MISLLNHFFPSFQSSGRGGSEPSAVLWQGDLLSDSGGDALPWRQASLRARHHHHQAARILLTMEGDDQLQDCQEEHSSSCQDPVPGQRGAAEERVCRSEEDAQVSLLGSQHGL